MMVPPAANSEPLPPQDLFLGLKTTNLLCSGMMILFAIQGIFWGRYCLGLTIPFVVLTLYLAICSASFHSKPHQAKLDAIRAKSCRLTMFKVGFTLYTLLCFGIAIWLVAELVDDDNYYGRSRRTAPALQVLFIIAGLALELTHGCTFLSYIKKYRIQFINQLAMPMGNYPIRPVALNESIAS